MSDSTHKHIRSFFIFKFSFSFALFFRFSFCFRFHHVEVTLLQYLVWLIIIIIIVTQCHHHQQDSHSQSLTIVNNSVQSTGSSQFCSVQFSWISSVQTYFKFSRRKTRRSSPLIILLRLPAVKSPQTLNTRSVYACDAGAEIRSRAILDSRK